jgi:hypothetical protein
MLSTNVFLLALSAATCVSSFTLQRPRALRATPTIVMSVEGKVEKLHLEPISKISGEVTLSV